MAKKAPSLSPIAKYEDGSTGKAMTKQPVNLVVDIIIRNLSFEVALKMREQILHAQAVFLFARAVYREKVHGSGNYS
jgi:hypothetical protein